jgi:hypothetical protein
MKKSFFLKFSLINVLNSPSELVFYFVRRKYASFSLNFSLFVLMICLFDTYSFPFLLVALPLLGSLPAWTLPQGCTALLMQGKAH